MGIPKLRAKGWGAVRVNADTIQPPAWNGEIIERRRGLPALLACFAVMLVLTAAAAAYKRDINYGTADTARDAINAFAGGDSRYLVVGSSEFAVQVPNDLAELAGEPLDVDRDVRLLRPLSDQPSSKSQLEYVRRYNSTMAVLVRGATPAGGHFVRPKPMSRVVFWLECIVVLAPFMVIFYLRYRLGPYRTDGRLWVVSLLETRHLMPSTYREDGWFLLRLLWITMALTIPWTLFVVFGLFRDYGPLQ